MTRTHASGFTLIEIVLVIALIALVTGVGLRLPYVFDPLRNADNDAFAVRSALYRAESSAVSGRGGAPWGVLVASGQVTVFQGPSFADRVPDADITTALDASPRLVDATEIVFAPLTGAPATAATISLGFGTETVHLSVNAHGVITTTHAP